MRIIVLGAGGVGSLLGGMLAHSGAEIAFVARGAQLAALRSAGLRVESSGGPFHLNAVEAADSSEALAPADVVLVSVKSWQVAEVAPSIARLLRPDGFVLPLENGVDAAAILSAELGEARVVGGLCAMLAWIEAPGVVRHIGAAPRVVVGERHGVGRSRRLEALVEQLRAAHIDALLSDDIEASIWEKFLFISAFGSVGAATRARVGVVRTLPETRALLEAAMCEVESVARARKVQLRDDAVAIALSNIDALTPDATASMQRDIQAGRPSELYEQVASVVRMAHECHVAAPTFEFLLATLLPQELAARNRS